MGKAQRAHLRKRNRRRPYIRHAPNTLLALKNAGVKDVRMYFGSWNEWSRDPSLPIEEGLPIPAIVTSKAA